MAVTTVNNAQPSRDQPARPASEQTPAASTPWWRRWDLSLAHGPVMGPLNAGLGLVGVGMVADLAGVSPAWGAVSGVAAATAAGLQGARRRLSPGGLVWRASCWAGAGGWLTWALATSAWAPDVLAAAAAGTLAAGLGAPVLAGHETRVSARRAAAAAAAQAEADTAAAAAARLQVAQEWEARLDRVCSVRGARVEAVQSWPSGGGYSLQVRLPPGGVTWRQIAVAADGLAGDADLPNGCGVEVAPGTTRAVVILRVSTNDATAAACDYPADLTALTFTAALPIGRMRNGATAAVNLLDDPAMIIGRRGSGKTVAMQVITADLVRCTDTLVWHIDLNGAGMSRPWLAPWMDGQTTRPVIDWVAATVEEALVMVQTAIDIAIARKSAYAGLMAAVDDDKLPISASVPAIVIVLDEGAEAMALNRGNTLLTALLDKLISIARAARVQVVFSGLRPTSEIIPVQLKKQAGVKIFMRPDDPDEVSQLFGYRSGVTLDDAPDAGSGLLRTPATRAITPYRGYDLRPSQIRAIAAAVTDRRPVLDEPSARAVGVTYTARWARYRTWQHDQGGAPMPADPDDQPTPATGSTADNAGTPKAPDGSGMAGLMAAAAEMDASMERLREYRAQVEARQQFEAIAAAELGDLAGLSEQILAADAGPPSPPASDPARPAQAGPVDGPAVMLAILRTTDAGIAWDDLLARLQTGGVSVSKATMYRWLAEAEAAGQVHQPQRGWWAPGPGPA